MRWWATLGLLVLGSCTGEIDDPARGPTGPRGGDLEENGRFLCDPSGLGSPSPLRRLSIVQYRNTVRDLFAPTPVDALADASAEIDRLPVDESGESFRNMDARLSDQHVRGFFRVADRLATASTSDAALAAIAGDCALGAAPYTACVDGFLDGFAARAFRRPLTGEERARYQALDDGTRDGRELFRALVFSILMAPPFLYHVEVEGEAVRSDELHYALGPYELASRLAYHFWQSMPDAALLAAAEDGSLLTEEGYAAEARRVFEDPRTEDAVDTFYREWFRLGTMTELPATPGFATFAEGTTIGEPGADHLRAMDDEIVALTRHFTWGAGGSMRDLLLTDLSFTRSPHLAALYGVEAWDGVGPQPRLPAAERSGILTRAAFLLSGTHNTHPIHRGAVVRRRVLCDELPQPDPASLPPGSLVPPPVTADQTTRERFENKVQNEPCASCHRMMNPIGYVLESFDAIGRFRHEERIIDESTGEVLNVLPIDSSSTPEVVRGDTTVMSTGVELSRAVADSGRADACFARHYFRFTFAREESADDGCALERVRAILGEGGSLRDALFAIAMDPGFKSRRVAR
jgi:hypothetical protein